MTPIADMVEQMLSANAPAAAIVAAVRAVESITRDVTLSSRDASRSIAQEQARVRALNYRNRKKLQQVAKANDVATSSAVVALPSVTRHVTSTAKPLTSSFLLDGIDEEKEEKEERRNARARGSRLRPGQPLTDPFLRLAIEHGAPADAVPALWTEFVDYWSEIPGQRGCKVSWIGTWRNNVKRVISKGFLKRAGTGPPSRPLTQHQLERQETREILNDLDKFINAGGSGSGQADLGLLRFDPGDGSEIVHNGAGRDVVRLPAAGAGSGRKPV